MTDLGRRYEAYETVDWLIDEIKFLAAYLQNFLDSDS
jgi:hypothetical protein